MAVSATARPKETQYLWEGKDKRGHKVRGKSLAANEQALRADLRKQGVAPTRVRSPSRVRGGGKVQPQDIAVFARQLATMMSAGIPMVQAFEIIGNGHEKPAVQKLVLDIKSNIEGGSTLHESLAKHPLYFDDLFVNLVEAGEHAGALETLLDKIATYKEKTEALKKKIKKALFYPIAVLVIAVIVSVILLIFVIPQFESLFKGFGADLPAFTQMVVGCRNRGWRRDIRVHVFSQALEEYASLPGSGGAEISRCRTDIGQICHCPFRTHLVHDVCGRCAFGRSDAIRGRRYG
jgi:type IV pilus assembly protein PilC